jgi:hypothetical protein
VYFFVVFRQLFWQGHLLFTNKKNTSVKERANAALATLQQNARAMNILRSSLESRMNLIISNRGSTEDYEELAGVLDLVKKGELVLNAISDRKESAQYLEEFITIINNAALSMGEVRNDIDDTIVVAGALLSQLHNTICKVPTGVLPDSRDEIEPHSLLSCLPYWRQVKHMLQKSRPLHGHWRRKRVERGRRAGAS